MSTRYPDIFRNSLMDSHEISVRGELWFNLNESGDNPAEKIGDLEVLSGSVTCDRQASVRRTATVQINPNALTNATLGPKLTPYGSGITLFRGVHYPSGGGDEKQIFTGRIDGIDESFQSVTLQCSDQAAMVVDSRFTGPKGAADYPSATLVRDLAKALILDVLPHADVTFDSVVAANNTPVSPGTSFGQERADALDSLATQIQAEWYADTTGKFKIVSLPPAITAATEPVWIVDSGDAGVMISRASTTDRAGIANGIFVTGEPIGGPRGAPGQYLITEADDPNLYWDGPYGQVPKFYTGQQVNTPALANALAKTLAGNEMAAVSSVNVECIVNPALALGDVVRVYDGRARLDKMMFIQSMTIPLGPHEKMTMLLHRSIIKTTTGLREAPLSVGPGVTWSPR